MIGSLDWPVTWIEGIGSRPAGPLDGMHVLAVGGAAVETIRRDGTPVARVYDDGAARHLLAGDLTPPDVDAPPADQARAALERLDAVLAEAGLGLSALARTWLFLDDILSWYGPLNAARTAFYRERGVFNGVVPASTGVAGRNAAGAALALGAWAVRPRSGTVRVREIPSPLQGPAPAYGSSFSRAVEIAAPDLRRLLVSGTASIAPDGRTERLGDVDGQIARTMEVVGRILSSRRMGWAAVTRTTAYFKDARDLPRLDAWAAGRGIPPLPLVRTATTICRDDLLYEIEVDAADPRGSGKAIGSREA